MNKSRLLGFFLLCLRIILSIFIIIPLVFFSYRLIEGRMEDIANIGNQDYHSGTGLYIFASCIVLFCINAILMILGGVGWLFTKKYKAAPIHAQNILPFRYLTFAPIISHLMYILIILIVANIR